MHCENHRLVVQHTRLVHDNRALRWLLAFQNDSELSTLLAWADDEGSFEHVLHFLSWALERELLISKEESLDLPSEQFELPDCPYCSQSMPF